MTEITDSSGPSAGASPADAPEDAARRVPSQEEIDDALWFLTDQAQDALSDGNESRARIYRGLHTIVSSLADRAADVSGITRVTIVTETGRAFEQTDLYTHGARLVVQDDGRTLKILPAAIPTT